MVVAFGEPNALPAPPVNALIWYVNAGMVVAFGEPNCAPDATRQRTDSGKYASPDDWIKERLIQVPQI